MKYPQAISGPEWQKYLANKAEEVKRLAEEKKTMAQERKARQKKKRNWKVKKGKKLRRERRLWKN